MKNLIKFNESSKFFEIKSLVDNLKDMLVELNDANISYQIEPSNEIKVKFVSLGMDGYFYVFLKNLESKKDSYNLIIENIKMIIDYMDGNGFETKFFIFANKLNSKMNKDTYSDVVTMNRLLMQFESRKPVYFLQLDFIMKNKPVLECLPNEKSIKQLEMVTKLSKKTDIGNRISDMNKEGANIHWIQNPIETGIESREDYEKNNRKKMKHLKKFNESINKLFENNNLEELEEEVRNLCESSLSFLYDKGFEPFVTDVEDMILIELSKYETINGELDNTLLTYSWDEIKEEFIPFMEMINEKYKIQEIVFYEDVDNEFSRDDESTISDLLEQDFDRKVIQTLQVFIKNN